MKQRFTNLKKGDIFTTPIDRETIWMCIEEIKIEFPGWEPGDTYNAVGIAGQGMAEFFCFKPMAEVDKVKK